MRLHRAQARRAQGEVVVELSGIVGAPAGGAGVRDLRFRIISH